MGNIGLLTSGGDAPGMNAIIRSVVRSSIYYGEKIFGIKNGYEGLIDGEIIELVESSVADIIQKGGTILGTSRSKRFLENEGFKKAINSLNKFNIDKLIVIGGDGSLKGAIEISKYNINVVGIPASIDNDLGYTDYTIGFFSAVSTVSNAISNIRDTTDSHNRANVVEVMGRNCGDIALYSGIASGAESIIVPEKNFDLKKIVEKALKGKKRGKRHHIIIISEGVGDTREFAYEFEKISGIDTKITILGYIQRGGNPNIMDRIYGSMMGNEAVKRILNEKNLAIGIKNNKIIALDLEKALKEKKIFKMNLNKLIDIISI